MRGSIADATLPMSSSRRLDDEFVDDLRRALDAASDGRELGVVYQPQVDLLTRRIVGVEALVRWDHPLLGPLGPASFVPVAERSGLVDPLGRWVLGQALHDLRRWQRLSSEPLSIELSVNVAAGQLTRRLVTDVDQACAGAGVDPSSLILEITETTRIEPRAVHEPLRLLRAMGVRVALDDFGTGWSPLSHLHQLPVDVLKLDRTFVTAPHARSADAIVRAMTALADELGLHVIAEGIETPAEHARLVRFGCETGQGYLFARPMAPADVAILLQSAAARTAS